MMLAARYAMNPYTPVRSIRMGANSLDLQHLPDRIRGTGEHEFF